VPAGAATPETTTTTTLAPAASPSASLSAAPSSSSPSASATGATVSVAMIRVVSDPAGASVRDETNELCASTPCDLTFKGDLADASRLHKLTIVKPGYRSETRTVKRSDSPLNVKLAKVGGAFVRPAPAPAPAPKASDGTTPTQPGFKDIPY
jgi:serine/threonine-protein kinase